MKRNLRLLFLFLAATCSCFACKDQEIPQEKDIHAGTVQMEASPVTDQLGVPITLPAHVMPAAYKGVAKALAARVRNQVPLDDENLEVIIMHASQIDRLDLDATLAIIDVLADEGTVVIAEPSLEQLDDFCVTLSGLFLACLEDSDIQEDDLQLYLSSPPVQQILSWAETTPFEDLKGQGKAGSYELIALRSDGYYTDIDEDSWMAGDEEVEVEYRNPETGEMETMKIQPGPCGTVSDYCLGLQADNLAEWINTHPDLEESRSQAVRALETRAGTASLDDLVRCQTRDIDITLPLGFTTSPGNERIISHPFHISYEIWSAYSHEKQLDYYFIKQRVTAYNDKLGCGPGDASQWYNPEHWRPWQDFERKAEDTFAAKMNFVRVPKHAFGPYFRSMYLKNSLIGGTPTVMDQSPVNSTSGGVTTTESMTFTIGGNIGVASGKPAGSLSASASWGTSVSKFSPDLSAKITNGQDGSITWEYWGPHVEASYHIFKTNTHGTPRSIQTSTCVLEQAWIWSVQTDASQLYLHLDLDFRDEWLVYSLISAYCSEAYLPANIEGGDSVTIECPPRYIQEWTMTVEPANPRVEDYLDKHLGDYFWTNNSSFCTRYPKHVRGGYDEINAYVALSKEYFTKNMSIMRLAGQAGGVEDAYTIRWHDLQNGISDEYSFEVKMH